jgi:hypothetical protein
MRHFRSRNQWPTFRSGRSRKISEYEREIDEDFKKIIIKLVLILIPLFFVTFEYYHRQRINILWKIKLSGIKNIGDKLSYGNIVYAKSSRPIKSHVYDKDFEINHDALTLKRKTEYCQWKEFSYKKCDSNNKNCVEYYNYVKSWTDYIVPSMFFNQPFNHFNPIRNPFPSGIIYSPETTFKTGKYHIDVNLGMNLLPNIRAPLKLIKYSILPNAFNISDAHKNHDFKYIGDGYFYSKYKEESNFKVLRMIGMLHEESLFDWQIGDLMNSCTPGDIRVRFHIQQPNVISVIGVVTESNKKSVHLEAIPEIFNEGTIGSIWGENISVDEMINNEIVESRQRTYLTRSSLVIWSFFVTFKLFKIDISHDYLCWIISSFSLAQIMVIIAWPELISPLRITVLLIQITLPYQAFVNKCTIMKLFY